MAFKIMGVAAGRKDSNGEILLKEALDVCRKDGAEVIFLNLRDYTFEDCIGCTHCTQGMFKDGKNVGCVLDKKDDKKRLMEAMLVQDAIIYSAPTYDLQASANFTRFMQRNLAFETAFLEKIGAIAHRDKIAGLIACGGSTRTWMSMALETMQAAMFSCDYKVVDMYLATRVGAKGHVLAHPEKLERARKMGENIMISLKKAPEEREWEGDEGYGWCPNCHSNSLSLGEAQWDGLHFPVECQVCGCGGTLEKGEGNKWNFVIDKEKGFSRDRTTVEGRGQHLVEIKHTEGGFYTPENLKMVKGKIVKYKEMTFKSLN